MNRDYEVSDRYYGIDGWLLLFIIILTVVLPLQAFSEVVRIFLAAQNEYQRAWKFDIFTIADCIANIFLAFAGIYCGTLLAIKSSQAVAMTKNYLIILAFYAIYHSTVYVVFASQEWRTSDHVYSSMLTILDRLFFVAIWYAYLTKSERVAATYNLAKPSP